VVAGRAFEVPIRTGEIFDAVLTQAMPALEKQWLKRLRVKQVETNSSFHFGFDFSWKLGY
jgi:hypothetical protein